MHSEYQGEGCLVCGRTIKTEKFLMNLTIDHKVWADNEGRAPEGIDQGWFPVGSECAKQFAAGVLHKLGAAAK
jgi:hypothetical protein